MVKQWNKNSCFMTKFVFVCGEEKLKSKIMDQIKKDYLDVIDLLFLDLISADQSTKVCYLSEKDGELTLCLVFRLKNRSRETQRISKIKSLHAEFVQFADSKEVSSFKYYAQGYTNSDYSDA